MKMGGKITVKYTGYKSDKDGKPVKEEGKK
jgi:hypothetical protein